MVTHESFFIIAVGDVVRKLSFVLGLLHTVGVLFFVSFLYLSAIHLKKCASDSKKCA